MARLDFAGLSAFAQGAPVTLAAGSTTIAFTVPPPLPTIGWPDYVALTLEPGGANAETVHLVVYSEGQSTGQVTRMSEPVAGGAVSPIAHSAVPWVQTDDYVPSPPAAAAAPAAPQGALNTKFRGGNIAPKPGGNAWRGLFWEWDWANWIKPQVDRASSLGLNAVRLIGSPEVVLRAPSGGIGQITQATYLARWAQLAAYCQQQRLFLYPCLCQKWDYSDCGVGYSDAGVNGVVAASAQTLAAFGNVVGFDVFQEGDSTGGVLASDVLNCMAAVRAVAPTTPVTCSRSLSDGFGWYDTTSLNYQVFTAAGGADFLDFHVYQDGLLPSDPDFQFNIGKPVIIGEFGDSQDQTTTAQTARYNAMVAVHNRTNVLGSFVWALADQDTVSTNMWGVWDNTGFGPAFPATSTTPLSVTSGKRTAMTNTLPSFSRTDRPDAYKAPNLLTPQQAHPTASAGGWQVGANTYTTPTNLGLAVAATAAGNVLVSTKPTNGTPVAASTAYIASLTVLASPSYYSRPVSVQIDWYNSSNAYVSSSAPVTVVDSTVAPTHVSVVAISASTAAYGVVTFKGSGWNANENHIILNVSLRQYGAGDFTPSSYPVAGLPSGEARLFGAPSGALWTSLDRTQVAISASLGLLTSGTPRGCLGGLAAVQTMTGVKFLTGTQAAVTPANWWVALTNTSGTVLAVSADQTTAAIAASSVITVPFTAPTVIPAGAFYVFLMVNAATVPTLAGVSGLLNSPSIPPMFSGNSTSTGQTTPPAAGGSVGVPSAQSSSVHWAWLY